MYLLGDCSTAYEKESLTATDRDILIVPKNNLEMNVRVGVWGYEGQSLGP